MENVILVHLHVYHVIMQQLNVHHVKIFIIMNQIHVKNVFHLV